MSAGHHIIYSGPKDCIVVSEADKAELEKLGWFLDPDGRCWAHFVN